MGGGRGSAKHVLIFMVDFSFSPEFENLVVHQCSFHVDIFLYSHQLCWTILLVSKREIIS